MRFFLLLALAWPAAAQLPPDFNEIRRAGSITEPFAGPQIRLLVWNIERGQRFNAVADALVKHPADLLLLQEVDLHARRTDGRDIAAELAFRTGHEFVFAPEFLELGQRIRGADALHGQATLSSLPIRRPRLMRHQEQHPSWRPSRFLPLWGVFQPRYGGRVALITEHETAHGLLVVYNLHLESRGPDSIRVSQIQEVLEDARLYPASATILIAGDLNTKKADSPVIDTIRKAGFTTLLGGEVTTKRRQPLDWIFLRGPWTAADARIHYEIRSSDHFPLTLTLQPAPLPLRSAPR